MEAERGEKMPEVPSYCMVGLGFEPRSLWLRVSNHSAIRLLWFKNPIFTKPTPGISSGPGINTWLRETQLFGGGNSCSSIYSFAKPHELKHQKNPGWVAQLGRALSQYIKVAGLIPGQGTYKNQPMSPDWCGSVDWVPACKPKGH